MNIRTVFSFTCLGLALLAVTAGVTTATVRDQGTGLGDRRPSTISSSPDVATQVAQSEPQPTASPKRPRPIGEHTREQ